MKIITFLFFSLVLLCATAKSQSIEGIWVGTYLNKNLKQPLVRILDFKTKDSSVIITYFNKPDGHFRFSIKNNVLIIDTKANVLDLLTKNKLAFHAIKDTSGIWSYGEYHRPEQVGTFAFSDSLVKYVWQYKRPEKENLLETTTHIFTDNDKLIESRIYYNQGRLLFKEQEQHCYEIRKYKNLTLLLWKTGADSCNVFNSLEQFVNIVKDTMFVYNPYYSEHYIPYIKTAATKDFPANKPFSLCDGTYTFLYARVEADHKGGKKAIFRQIQAKITPCNSNNKQSGYIRLGFVLNCKGETGHFNLLEMNRNYQPMRFESCVSNPIILAVRALKDWIPGTPTTYCSWWKGAVDTDYFLMFKIENGTITEVFP